jgi:hypothetical protein
LWERDVREEFRGEPSLLVSPHLVHQRILVPQRVFPLSEYSWFL